MSAALSACADLDEFEETYVDVLVVPGSAGPGSPFAASYEGGLADLNLSRSQAFAEAGVSPSDVDSIRVVAGSLAVDLGDPRLNDLSMYIESLELFVVSDNRPRTSVTRVENLPDADALELPLQGSPELKPFATDTGMRFDADVRLRMRPVFNLRLTTSLTLRVDINLLGS